MDRRSNLLWWLSYECKYAVFIQEFLLLKELENLFIMALMLGMQNFIKGINLVML